MKEKWPGGKKFASNEEFAIDGYFEKLESSHYKQSIEAIEYRWDYVKQ